jgi:hypothetical protein
MRPLLPLQSRVDAQGGLEVLTVMKQAGIQPDQVQHLPCCPVQLTAAVRLTREPCPTSELRLASAPHAHLAAHLCPCLLVCLCAYLPARLAPPAGHLVPGC